jgi:hypothetical protein
MKSILLSEFYIYINLFIYLFLIIDISNHFHFQGKNYFIDLFFEFIRLVRFLFY